MRIQGTVKWFNPIKGYGFITPQNGDKDIFVHMSAVRNAGIDKLDENQQVEFEIEKKQGRESAVNLKLI